MKNLLFVATAVLFTLAFTSCQKDGQFVPKERISKIYTSNSNSSEKHLECVFTWDDKKLSKIDHLFWNGDLDWTETFSYDNKNRIERVEDLEYNEYVQFKYEGNKLKSLEYYSDDELWLTSTFTYHGNKISRMDLVFKDSGITMDKKTRFSLISKKFKNKISPKNDGSDYDVSIELKWNGSNVSYMKATSTSTGTRTGYDGDDNTYDYSYTFVEECNYTYDNKLNPLKGLWNIATMTDEESIMCLGIFSKNNITSITYTETETYIENGQTKTRTYTHVENYNITYDGKFPTEIMTTSPGSSNVSTTYYEYE